MNSKQQSKYVKTRMAIDSKKVDLLRTKLLQKADCKHIPNIVDCLYRTLFILLHRRLERTAIDYEALVFSY